MALVAMALLASLACNASPKQPPQVQPGVLRAEEIGKKWRWPPPAVARASLLLSSRDQTFDEDRFNALLDSLLEDESLSLEGRCDLLLAYADGHEKGRDRALRFLIDNESPLLSQWLDKNQHRLKDTDWEAVTDTIGNRSFTESRIWCPESLRQILLRHSTGGAGPLLRDRAIITLNIVGVSTEEALAVAKQLPSVSNLAVRRLIYTIQSAHDDPRTNKLVRDGLADESNGKEVLGPLIEHGLVNNSRYDLLPELHRLRSKLARQADIRKKNEYDSIIRAIDEAIPALEAKKAAKAPIGRVFTKAQAPRTTP